MHIEVLHVECNKGYKKVNTQIFVKQFVYMYSRFHYSIKDIYHEVFRYLSSRKNIFYVLMLRFFKSMSLISAAITTRRFGNRSIILCV